MATDDTETNADALVWNLRRICSQAVKNSCPVPGLAAVPVLFTPDAAICYIDTSSKGLKLHGD